MKIRSILVLIFFLLIFVSFAYAEPSYTLITNFTTTRLGDAGWSNVTDGGGCTVSHDGTRVIINRGDADSDCFIAKVLSYASSNVIRFRYGATEMLSGKEIHIGGRMGHDGSTVGDYEGYGGFNRALANDVLIHDGASVSNGGSHNPGNNAIYYMETLYNSTDGNISVYIWADAGGFDGRPATPTYSYSRTLVENGNYAAFFLGGDSDGEGYAWVYEYWTASLADTTPPTLSDWNVTSGNVHNSTNSTVWRTNTDGFINITSDLLTFLVNASEISNCSAVLNQSLGYYEALNTNSNYGFATTMTKQHSYTVYDSISKGDHYLFVSCVDNATIPNMVNVSLNLSRINNNPSIPNITYPYNNTNITSSTGIINFKFNSNDADGDSLTYNYSINGSSYATTSSTSKSYTFLADGRYNFSVSACDGDNCSLFNITWFNLTISIPPPQEESLSYPELPQPKTSVFDPIFRYFKDNPALYPLFIVFAFFFAYYNGEIVRLKRRVRRLEKKIRRRKKHK
jgi:hypothetical protein